jgi:hypothetical protein
MTIHMSLLGGTGSRYGGGGGDAGGIVALRMTHSGFWAAMKLFGVSGVP